MDTESVDIKKESTTSRLEGAEGKRIILHFNASRKFMLVFSFNFIFLSCLGNVEKLRNGLRIFITDSFSKLLLAGQKLF